MKVKNMKKMNVMFQERDLKYGNMQLVIDLTHLTLDKNKMDRYLDEFIRKIRVYIRNNRRLKGSKIQYLLIPEQHKDGAYHMHGLIKGINPEELVKFKLEDNIPMMIKALIQCRVIYNWYNKKIGWVTLEKIKRP